MKLWEVIKKQEIGNIFLFPTIQFGSANTRIDEEVMNCLLDFLQKSENDQAKFFQLFGGAGERIKEIMRLDKQFDIHMATPYFNLTDSTANSLLSSPSPVSILTASPKANGFFGSKGLSGYIPLVYSFHEWKFFSKVEEVKKTEEKKIFEYVKEGWTFHGKGLWFTPSSKTTQSDNFMVTVVGSSNWGERSRDRDVESQLVVFSFDQQFSDLIKEERDNLFQGTELVTKETFEDKSRKFPFWINFLSSLVKKFT
eukprot:TRINITY_DN8767_c0_g1_i1.p2 TRINITY_DN8767_c0_g1~~TRINITY_DN8767_c0_g1_i1.p2  ORF type:complete len:254 (+),score=67.15 TRINITY_DN8767_c0_g1_i1:1449-2210(+)